MNNDIYQGETVDEKENLLIKILNFVLISTVLITLYLLTIALGSISNESFNIPFFQIVGSILTPILLLVSVVISCFAYLFTGTFDLAQNVAALLPRGKEGFDIIIAMTPITIVISKIITRTLNVYHFNLKFKIVQVILNLIVSYIAFGLIYESFENGFFSGSGIHAFPIVIAGLLCWFLGRSKDDSHYEDDNDNTNQTFLDSPPDDSNEGTNENKQSEYDFDKYGYFKNMSSNQQ